MLFRQLFDPETSSYTYLLADPTTGEAVIIDPVAEQVERDLSLIRELGLTLVATLETHVHADHVTGGGPIRDATGARYGVAASAELSCSDTNLREGDRVVFGSRHLEVRETPGHTNTCLSYVLDDLSMAFTGDALMIRGCGRTDFQAGDAATLYQSVHAKLFSLPDGTLVYPAHDYKGRTASSVGEEKVHNPRLGGANTVADFVKIMDGLGLSQPKKIHIAVPGNTMCGCMEADGARP